MRILLSNENLLIIFLDALLALRSVSHQGSRENYTKIHWYAEYGSVLTGDEPVDMRVDLMMFLFSGLVTV